MTRHFGMFQFVWSLKGECVMRTSSSEPVHLGVGIDTARYGHHVSFMNVERDLVAPGLAISESAEGYQRLRKQLEKLQAKHPKAHFHILPERRR